MGNHIDDCYVPWTTSHIPMVPPEPMPYDDIAGPPDVNPKTLAGGHKAPIHLVPPSAMVHLAAAFKDGAKKYTSFSWRDHAMSSTTLYSAAMRHMLAWFDGEDRAEDSGVHHLAHAMANMALILDSLGVGLNDDRPKLGPTALDLKESQDEQ